MSKRKGKSKTEQKAAWEKYLALAATAAAFAAILPADFRLLTHSLQVLLSEAAKILCKKINDVDGLLQEVRNSTGYQNPHEPSQAALLAFENSWKSFKGLDPSHWEKRAKIHELGIKTQPYCFSDLLQLPREKRPFNIEFIRRKRVTGVKARQTMGENAGSHHNGYTVNSSTGYHVVEPDTSVIFYDISENGEYQIELIVIRNVGTSTSFSGGLFKWLLEVVECACSERRDTRPNHGGHISQIGLNLGPRHARALGWASSFTLKLDDGTKALHDLDVIGAVSLTWSLIRSVMPHEILEEVGRQLEGSGLPRLATRNVKEGCGFQLKFDGKTYLFPTAERAPPEAYLSQGYEAWTHTDPAYCKWAFLFCVDRTVTANTPQAHQGISTRSSSQKRDLKKTPKPSRSGGSFVDASLKVVVRQARGTIAAFQPVYMHGTSIVNGARNSIISINFSSRLAEAWEKVGELGRASVTASSGAGDGNTWAL